jgi:hypothetical protein
VITAVDLYVFFFISKFHTQSLRPIELSCFTAAYLSVRLIKSFYINIIYFLTYFIIRDVLIIIYLFDVDVYIMIFAICLLTNYFIKKDRTPFVLLKVSFLIFLIFFLGMSPHQVTDFLLDYQSSCSSGE